MGTKQRPGAGRGPPACTAQAGPLEEQLHWELRGGGVVPVCQKDRKQWPAGVAQGKGVANFVENP